MNQAEGFNKYIPIVFVLNRVRLTVYDIRLLEIIESEKGAKFGNFRANLV